MVNGERTLRHDRLLGVALVLGFLVLVGTAVGVYVVGESALHLRLRTIAPAVVRSIRMPAVGPVELVLGAAVVIMTVAFIALLVHDARAAE